ncbi:hypothetical protein [Nocardioides sp. TF02-7]|uniref:hypothetical protein n=1 Tax=Nocardioides sp. TF02-7 TaxID=2917724 RepID=UPI001F05F3C0|nr:hypothetical protein [Nocardioides sp. TF02-7]UMG95010.1 hypothetical protein MF408_09530 [Nocardioides sp. TF02-7]
MNTPIGTSTKLVAMIETPTMPPSRNSLGDEEALQPHREHDRAEHDRADPVDLRRHRVAVCAVHERLAVGPR